MHNNSSAVNLFIKSYLQASNSFDEFLHLYNEEQQEQAIVDYFNSISLEKLNNYQKRADNHLEKFGVTFRIYNDISSNERCFPFDIIPRIITHKEWIFLEKGLKQRILALNCFLQDVYTNQEIIKANKIPKELILSSPGYEPLAKGIKPSGGAHIHISGIDIIRNEGGDFFVLEDNLQTPSGVSYVLENRDNMKRLMPDILLQSKVLPVDDYPLQLRNYLQALAKNDGILVLLTPGPLNSAYFEHADLAKRMGCDLVQGQDLYVKDDHVYLKNTNSSKKVAIIYKRIDDNFLDPLSFNKDSLLGVPGLFDVYRKGNVVLANAIGNGIADDKAIYNYVPEMIKFYLSEEPILSQVTTYICFNQKDREYVFKNIKNLVVKKVNGYGGNDIFMGPFASNKEISECLINIEKKPRNYLAQPLISLSSSPTLCNNKIVSRRVDFRPFVLFNNEPWVLPGGLTRVALQEGSYIVNSSFGGGSKDSWILGT